MKDRTIRVDDIECIHCGHLFDGQGATNYSTESMVVKCPQCGGSMVVSQSIEYLATPEEE